MEALSCVELFRRNKPTTTNYHGIGIGSGDGGRLLFWAMFLMTVSVDGLCIPREREALLSFKRGLTDPSNILSSWSWVEDGVDCCHWRGVVCHNSTGHVLQIRLGCKGSTCPETKAVLGGKLSPSLLNLKHLTHLDLSFNDFERIPIPRFLGSLQSLTYLNLSWGGFGGIIPQQLGNLTNLDSLDLRYSFELRSDSLGWVTGLSKLQYLDLSWVDLSEARDWLQATNTLPSLKQLRLSSCQIISSAIAIPPTTLLAPNNFSHLSLLDLSWNYNSFSRVPEWVFSLPSLTFLDLSANSLSGPVPVGLANLTRLTTLHLSHNSFNSSIPECLFHLNKLATLDLSWNSLYGPIPVGLANLTRLTTLDLSQNRFNSSIPECLFHLNKLRVLRLGWNSLEGVIPEGIGNMTALSTLDLANNSKLECEGHVLFKSLGNLCSLSELGLSRIKLGREGFQAFMSLSDCLLPGLVGLVLRETQLTGKFGNLVDKLAAHSKSLAYLYLSSNSLHGPIPVSIGRLSSLEDLYVDHNQLDGTLPESLGQLTRLRFLYISDNQLIGNVTQAHFSNLTELYFFKSRNQLSLKAGPKWVPPFQLRYLDLDSWQIGPRFPHWLQSQKHLSWLRLSGVGISSTIPDWFLKSSPNCLYYNLSHNQIQGGISKFVQSNFPVDTVIDLGSNRLSGPLPPISPRVVRLHLSNNQFSGSISHFLCQKPSEQNRLELLDLGKNNLSGEISDCLMNWKSLIFINFEYNEFTGQFPSSIQSLRHLHSLYLRHNRFQGKLPISLKNCTSLVVMDLAGNYFLGSIPSWIGERYIAMAFLILRSNRFFGKIPRQLCALTSLQVLDLAHNNLSGSIPSCINNFTAMTIDHNSNTISIPLKTMNWSIVGRDDLWGLWDHAYIAMKDRTDEYSTTLGLVTGMDLSNNFLSGEIPKTLTSLITLRYLNLSYNRLTGRIPQAIGGMKVLESLDFSTNQLFGVIPTSISGLTFVNHFNVSNNKLVGKIPLSTQLQSFNASSFSGNQLCGHPLNDICSGSGASVEDEIEQGNKGTQGEVEWFYVSMVIGFIVGFWFIWAPLIFNKSWRQTYFTSLHYLWQRIIVLIRN